MSYFLVFPGPRSIIQEASTLADVAAAYRVLRGRYPGAGWAPVLGVDNAVIAWVDGAGQVWDVARREALC